MARGAAGFPVPFGTMAVRVGKFGVTRLDEKGWCSVVAEESDLGEEL